MIECQIRNKTAPSYSLRCPLLSLAMQLNAGMAKHNEESRLSLSRPSALCGPLKQGKPFSCIIGFLWFRCSRVN
jgi:hypothetical protein